MVNYVTDLFRYKLFTNCRILVNDMTPIIKFTQDFIYEKVIPYVKEVEGCDRLVFDGIEVRIENEQIVWSQYKKDDLYEVVTTKVKKDNLNELFGNGEDIIDNLKAQDIIVPKELYGNSFLCLAEVITDILYKEKLVGDVYNIYNIFMLSDNGSNNIIYEVQ